MKQTKTSVPATLNKKDRSFKRYRASIRKAKATPGYWEGGR